ncbi:MAG TPA: shikimate kinase, partial [Terriglobales bacterium]|nr:shikimate kinase [Terriglobales bacterium]
MKRTVSRNTSTTGSQASDAHKHVPTRSVFLAGFMGAGKTCVGEYLAKELGWRFIDLDANIEAREKRAIAAIFRESGEAEFRRVEHEELRRAMRELNSD